MRFIAWRTSGIGPNGRSSVELRWHVLLDEVNARLMKCGQTAPVGTQLMRFEGERPPGTHCDAGCFARTEATF